MVSTSAPSSCSASTVQDFTALPLTSTTQAPHCEVSQPTWVPVSRRFSRSNCTKSVRGSTSAVTDLPLTVRETAAMCASSGSPNYRFTGRLAVVCCLQDRKHDDFDGFLPSNWNYSELQSGRRSRKYRFAPPGPGSGQQPCDAPIRRWVG